MSDKQTADWHVDPALAPAIEEVLPDLAEEILTAIAREVPEYARPLEGSFGRGIRVGVDEALRQFASLVRSPAGDRAEGRGVYLGLGRGEFRQGRSLDSLLAAYRVGARVAWRRTSEAAGRAGHDPELVYELADAIFAYIDELSAESAEGFAAAQREREGEREMRRSRLLTALLSGAGRTEIEGLGAAAGWPIPESAAAAACAPDDAAPLARRLGAPVLSGTFGDVGCLVIADPDAPGAGRLLAAAAADLPLTIGPTVEPAAVADSWAEAERAHAARIAGMLPGPGLLRTGEHLAGLILAAEPALVERLARCRLEPLSGETDASRSRLTATLSTWLAEQGAIGSTAAILGVHPQTVRYRMARLRELFGPDLDDADARFELQLALRATRA